MTSHSSRAETDVVAVMPVYNPGPETVRVCASLSEKFGRLVVVDDGSVDNVPLFDRLPAGATLLRHDENKGKGQAIKTAVRWILEHCPACSGVVFVDGDGQHAPDDVLKVAVRMSETDRLALGVRRFSGAEVPWRSRFGNVMTSFAVRFMFQVRLDDTQTGLRAVPWRLLGSMLKISGDRYEYEIRALGHWLDCREPLEQVEIDTIYIGENRSSHFRPVWDSLRIYGGLARFGVVRFGKFVASSLLGFLTDNLVFTVLLFALDLSGYRRWASILVALALARIVSAAVNFLTNKLWVFRSTEPIPLSAARYCALAVVIAGLSYGGTAGISHCADAHGWVITAVKILIDTVLFVLSYRVQKRWVFGRN